MSSALKTRQRPHWGASRPADIKHNGRSLWRVPHDRERILLDYHYSEDGPTGGNSFDVRDLPEYASVGDFRWDGGDLTKAAAAHVAKEQAYHASIIRRCIDDGIDMQALTRAAMEVREKAYRARCVADVGCNDLDSEVPF